MRQDRTPLFDAIIAHNTQKKISFHVPAHMGRPLPGFERMEGQHFFAYDLTELPGLDDLHCPVGPLKEAEELAAGFFQARRTFFLVNGVTGGVVASHLYYGGSGKKVLLPRNAHKSHYSGIILAGTVPVYLPVSRQEDFTLNVTVADVEKSLKKHPDAAALFITSPGYHGVCADLPRIKEAAQEAGVPLVVDEAHGTHLCLSPLFPPGAGEAGADMWLQSTHKTGGALTQGVMLHMGQKDADYSRLSLFLSMTQTSSPSYLVLASLDEARRHLADGGRERAEEAAAFTRALKGELAFLDGVEPVEFPAFACDPLRLTVSTRQLGILGVDARSFLRAQGIEVELVGDYHLLFVISPNQPEKDFSALKLALQDLPASAPKGRQLISPAFPYQELPKQALLPRRALERASETVSIEEAVGRISSQMVVPSPPGIPLLVPGEEVTMGTAEYLQELKRKQITYHGAAPDLNTLKVLKE